MASVAYLGPRGTFSHIVARRRFRDESRLKPCESIGAVFQFLHDHPDALAVVPLENSSGGTIYDTVDLLIENAGRFFVREELELDVRIALLGRKGEPVKRVFSHFAQVQLHREWIARNLPGAKIETVASTAVAAARAAATKGGAALSAPGAAEIHGLDILKCPVIRGRTNVTHFLVLSRTEAAPARPDEARTAVAVSFSNECGSLYRFLEPFARARVNINRIISRPFQGDVNRAVFFMEIDGAPGVAVYDGVIERATRRSETFHCFGSYPWKRRIRS